MSRGVRAITLTSEVIKDYLKIPSEYEIYDIVRVIGRPDVFTLYIGHKDFDDLKECELPSYINLLDITGEK